MHEKVVETKSCKQCNFSFNITNKDLEFYDKISPKFMGEKFSIPTPKLCPDCRQQRRLSFRNERNLYKRKCDATGDNIISMLSPDKKNIVYGNDYWISDKWEALDYGLDINFETSFLEQIKKLLHTVPMASILNTETQNADFNNYIHEAKNCYMSYVVYYDSENIFYSSRIFSSTNIFDCLLIHSSENCYSSIDLKDCYNCFYSSLLEGCNNCYFSRNLRGCSFCIGSSNLTNKKYYIKNKSYTKEEYEKYLKTVNIFKNKDEYYSFIKHTPYLFNHSINSIESSGDYLKNCKNCKYCFDSEGSEDCKFVISEKATNAYDGVGGSLEYCYEYVRVGFSQKVFFSNDVLESQNIYYSLFLFACKNCFGCVGLRNKQYCILNKQYTRDEYEKLLLKVIKLMKKYNEWGEFFPSFFSLFGYNETSAQEYYPLDKNNCLNEGFNWSDYMPSPPKVDKIISANKLPDSINKIPDDILNWAIECKITKKPFKIIPQELEFYRKYNLPIPKKHPDLRHLDRMKLRNPRKLFDRKCDKCGINMKTTFSPDREEIVYCENCYNKKIY